MASDEAKAPADSTSEADKARARQWFKKAADCRERRDYDYAIECFITGLGFWPEAVEEGHRPLRSLAVQRAQAGGKKPGMMESMKHSTSAKDPKQAMLNAEMLLSKDHTSGAYSDALLRNAARGGFLQTVKWIAPLAYESMRKDAKPDKSRFKAFRQALADAAAKAEAAGDTEALVSVLDQAVNSLDFQLARNPSDEDLKIEQRNLSGKLTITRGKYQDSSDFHDSIRDADSQKLLHDTDRVKQGEQTLATLISAAKRDYEQHPEVPGKIIAYVEALLKPERKHEEDEAIAILMKVYDKTKNYSFKLRADDVRIRQLGRAARVQAERAQQTGADEDRQQARLAALEQRQTVLEVYRERVANYPTDLRLKVRLGTALFEIGEYEEAIPILQVAQQEPKYRTRCKLLLGRAFLERGNAAESVEILRDAIDAYELQDDTSKDLLYWLARSQEQAGRIDDAKATFGKLLRQDYNYAGGDARKRLEAIK